MDPTDFERHSSKAEILKNYLNSKLTTPNINNESYSRECKMTKHVYKLVYFSSAKIMF